MKATKRILAMLLALIMLCSVMAACGKKPAAAGTWDGAPKFGGHLNVRTSGLKMLDPMKNASTWRYLYTTAVYEPFLTRDSQYNIQPCVCGYELNEDQTVLKLWPREGYTFGRGYGQVEMDDIVASWNRGTLYNSVKNNVFPNIISQEVVMDETLGHEVFKVEFNYNERNMYYLASIKTWWPVMPKEICEKYANSYIIDQVEDAVGTGPYIFTDFQDSIQVTLTKRDDYVPVDNSAYTGFAGTKYGYMDSMTFWYNSTDASAALAVLSGDYDCTEVIPTEYAQMAADAGITLSTLTSDQRTWIYFNTMGTNNLVAKYPSLRKAIMASIDYPSFLDVICDSSQILEGDNILMDPLYDTTYLWKEADYYGEFDQAVVDKYMAMAEAEGYSGEPIQLVYHSGRTDIPTLLCDALENGGINYQLTTMEATTYSAFIGDPSNNWDLYYSWGVTATTPALLQDSLVETNYKSARKDEIREEMYKLEPTSDEYLALWEEWSKLWVEECQIGYLSAIDWWWWHPETLHINDDAENGNNARYMYNAYWDDPQNHPKK